MNGFWYMGSPYSRYAHGPAQAANHAIYHAGLLVERGVNIFTPVGHSYLLERTTGGRVTWKRWMELDFAILRGACGFIRLELPGWEQSKGMALEEEYAHFERGLPIEIMKAWPIIVTAPLQNLVERLIAAQLAPLK